MISNESITKERPNQTHQIKAEDSPKNLRKMVPISHIHKLRKNTTRFSHIYAFREAFLYCKHADKISQ